MRYVVGMCDDLLDALLGDDDELDAPPAAARPAQPTAMHRALQRMIESLRADELLAVEPSFSLDEVTDALIDALERGRSDSRAGAVSLVADALTEAPGVEELYADDEVLERLLRQAFADLGG